MKGFKGFDKNLSCRGFKYELGKENTHNGEASLCNSGFHFCENPLDVFVYYPPADEEGLLNRFAEVEADEVSKEKSDDSKRVAKRLTVKDELSLNNLVQLGVKFILDKVDFKNAPATNTGYQSAATNTGEEGCAVSLGIEGKAKGAIGCWLTLAEWKEIDGIWHRVDVRTSKVDGKKIKADIFYMLKGGKFVEAK